MYFTNTSLTKNLVECFECVIHGEFSNPLVIMLLMSFIKNVVMKSLSL